LSERSRTAATPSNSFVTPSKVTEAGTPADELTGEEYACGKL
jgi:hypothetical protein